MGKQVNREELAEIFGVQPGTITRWQKEDGFPVMLAGKRGASNVYDTEAVLGWKIQQEVARLVRVEGGETLDLNQERARLAKEQADNYSLKNAVLRADVIPAPLVQTAFQNQILAAKTRLLGIRSKLRGRLPDVPDAVLNETDALIRESLSELASEGGGMPGELRKVMEEYFRRLASAPETDIEPVG